MPYSRDTQLEGFTDFLSSAGGVLKRVAVGAASVGRVANQVENAADQASAQLPNVDAIARNPTAAARGAVAGSRLGAFIDEHPVAAAAGGAGALLLLVKLFR